MNGYILCRNDRTGKGGGGVAAYIRSDLKPKVILNSPSEYNARPEYLFIEISASLQRCLLCVVYKPPKVNHLNDIEIPLLNLLQYYDHVLVMGDLNTNLLSTSSSST